MTAGARNRKTQSGAALIVVLLLIATLSFILLSITNIVTASVKRSAADRARTDFYWRAAAGELIAQEILEKYLATSPLKMAPGEGIFAKPLEVPIEGGRATIGFRDATLCFNVNSLVASGSKSRLDFDMFITMLEAFGLGSGDANKIADVIVDFMDSDNQPEGQGVEDGFYTALPTPYRTSGQPLKSISELRAMDGVSPRLDELLGGQIWDNLCAVETAAAGKVNINWATKRDAPLLLALLPAGSTVTVGEITAEIEALPPGGISDPALLKPSLSAVNPAFQSDRIEAIITLEVNDLTIEEKLLFETKTGAPLKLLARTFGDDY